MSGAVDLATADAILAGAANDHVAVDLAIDGDVTGDGSSDLLVGASYVTHGTGTSGGVVYVISGP